MTQPRNRGIVRLDEEILHRVLDLPEGQRVTGFRADSVDLSIEVCIEGDGLPEVRPGYPAMYLDADQFVRLRAPDLADKVRALAGQWATGRNADAASALLRVLDEGWDPR